MGTYTWVVRDVSSAGAVSNAVFNSILINVPAGGIVKRFQVRNCALMLHQTGIGAGTVGSLLWTHRVTRNGPPGVGRSLYHASVGAQGVLSSLYDVATLQRVYDQSVSAGDEALRVNQPCSYGSHTDVVPSTYQYTPSLFDTGGILSPAPPGYVQYEFAVLYETL